MLLAYPKTHREEYGAAMAQLFHDQCRDAWNEARGLGLAKLWLRVLTELVSTSIRERIAALKETRAMNDKIASLSHVRTTPAAIFFRVFIAVFLFSVIVATLINHILPESYCSEAALLFRIRSDNHQTQDVAFDPNVILSELEILGSDQVLYSAITNLALDSEWSKRYATGRILNSDETIKMLRQRIIMQGTFQSGVLDIQVYDENPAEARSIARAILDSYLSYKVGQTASEPKNLRNINIIQSPTAPYLARPNKFQNVSLGVFAGIFLGVLAGGISAFLALKLGNRGNKNIAAA